MKIYFKLMVMILLPFNQACSQNSERIIGEWGLSLVQENRGQKFAIECPDYLLFESEGTYTIFNDCEMHEDNKEAIIERGNWNLNSKTMRITLSNREFTNLKFSDYTFHGAKENLTLVIDQILDNELWFCVDDGFDCIIEKYERKVN